MLESDPSGSGGDSAVVVEEAEVVQQQSSHYSTGETQFLQQHVESLAILGAAHFRAALKYSILFQTFSIAIILLPIVAILLKLSGADVVAENVLNAITSGLASISLFLNASKRSTEHRAGATAYRNLGLYIETSCLVASSPTGRPRFRELTQKISASLTEFEKTFPPLDADVLAHFANLPSNISRPLELGESAIKDVGGDGGAK